MAKPEATINRAPTLLRTSALPLSAIYINVVANAVRPSNEVAKNPLSLGALGALTIILGVIASEYKRR